MAIINVDVQIEIKSGKEVLEALTINQLTSLVGNTKQSVYSLINQKNKNNESYLDVCYPFPNSEDDKESGPMFVLLNEKGRCYLEKNIKKKRRVKKAPVQDVIPEGDTQFFIEEMFDKYLCKKVTFNKSHLKLAKQIDKEFTRKEITNAFKNISNSVHKKNMFLLINLDYMLRKSEIKRWSNQ